MGCLSSCFSCSGFPCGAWAPECVGSGCGAGALSLCSMWDLPGTGSNLCPPALTGRLPTAGLPGEPYNMQLVPTGQSDGNADVSFILLLSQLHWSFTVLASANPCFPQFFHQPTLASSSPDTLLCLGISISTHFLLFTSSFSFERFLFPQWLHLPFILLPC